MSKRKLEKTNDSRRQISFIGENYKTLVEIIPFFLWVQFKGKEVTQFACVSKVEKPKGGNKKIKLHFTLLDEQNQVQEETCSLSMLLKMASKLQGKTIHGYQVKYLASGGEYKPYNKMIDDQVLKGSKLLEKDVANLISKSSVYDIPPSVSQKHALEISQTHSLEEFDQYCHPNNDNGITPNIHSMDQTPLYQQNNEMLDDFDPFFEQFDPQEGEDGFFFDHGSNNKINQDNSESVNRFFTWEDEVNHSTPGSSNLQNSHSQNTQPIVNNLDFPKNYEETNCSKKIKQEQCENYPEIKEIKEYPEIIFKGANKDLDISDPVLKIIVGVESDMNYIQHIQDIYEKNFKSPTETNKCSSCDSNVNVGSQHKIFKNSPIENSMNGWHCVKCTKSYCLKCIFDQKLSDYQIYGSSTLIETPIKCMTEGCIMHYPIQLLIHAFSLGIRETHNITKKKQKIFSFFDELTKSKIRWLNKSSPLQFHCYEKNNQDRKIVKLCSYKQCELVVNKNKLKHIENLDFILGVLNKKLNNEQKTVVLCMLVERLTFLCCPECGYKAFYSFDLEHTCPSCATRACIVCDQKKCHPHDHKWEISQEADIPSEIRDYIASINPEFENLDEEKKKNFILFMKIRFQSMFSKLKGFIPDLKPIFNQINMIENLNFFVQNVYFGPFQKYESKNIRKTLKYLLESIKF